MLPIQAQGQVERLLFLAFGNQNHVMEASDGEIIVLLIQRLDADLEDVLVRDNRRGNQSQNQQAEDWLESDHGKPPSSQTKLLRVDFT